MPTLCRYPSNLQGVVFALLHVLGSYLCPYGESLLATGHLRNTTTLFVLFDAPVVPEEGVGEGRAQLR